MKFIGCAIVQPTAADGIASAYNKRPTCSRFHELVRWPEFRASVREESASSLLSGLELDFLLLSDAAMFAGGTNSSWFS